MTVYKFSQDGIREVPQTTFSDHGIRERDHVQRIIRESIEVIAPKTMVLAEEYGGWDGANRRIDLLCLDEERNLVVVELKRTETGGHMELQALRYAAMVSSMRFDQAVDAHRKYLQTLGRPSEDAEASIRKFLGQEEGAIALSDKVRIVLASASFSREVTTCVLWLNFQGNMDIRCVQLRPLNLDGQVLLDIRQVIPLPESADYQVAIREKSMEQAEERREGRDYSKYRLVIGDRVYESLPKRRLIYLIVAEALRLGLTPDDIRSAVPWRQERLFASAEGDLTGEEVMDAAKKDPIRFFCDDEDVFYVGGRTYVFSNQWGARTDEAVQNIIAALPAEQGVSYEVVT